MIKKNLKDCSARVNRLKKRVKAVLDNPPLNDEVYKITQRLFAGDTDLNLSFDHAQTGAIKRRAWRRFIQGCPPRKSADTSYGDAINWEWILECIKSTNSDVVIVSRDSDYGTKMDDVVYANDWLVTEVKRINKQRKVFVYDKLSDALPQLNVRVSAEEEREEKTLAGVLPPVSGVTAQAGIGIGYSGYSGYSGATGDRRAVDWNFANPHAPLSAVDLYRMHLDQDSS